MLLFFYLYFRDSRPGNHSPSRLSINFVFCKSDLCDVLYAQRLGHAHKVVVRSPLHSMMRRNEETLIVT